MSEEYKDLTKSEEQAAKPVQPMPQPVQQVFYDPYIYRLQHEQPVVVRTEQKKPSAAKRFFLLVGALAGGAFIGVKALDEKFGKKEEAPTEESVEGTNELDVKKPKTGIVLQTSKDVGETSVSAVDVSAVAESAMPSVVAINNYSKQTYSYFFYDYETRM